MEKKRSLLQPKVFKEDKQTTLHWAGSSDVLRKLTNFNEISDKRLKTMMIVILCCFLVIAFHLINLQVYQQDDYIVKLEKYNQTYQKVSPPRGQIYDRNYELIVENIPLLNITYTPARGITNEEEWEMARMLVEQFELSLDSYTLRDMKDAYIKLYPQETAALITESEMSAYYNKLLTDNDIYTMKLERITQEDIDKEDEIDILAGIIKIGMDNATSVSPSIILEDVEYEKAVYIAEHKEVFKGFDNSYDWQRNYVYGDTLRSVLGKVSTSKQGLPSESKTYLTALGYALNERVGTSGIEQQYEELLKGEYMYIDQSYDTLTGLPIQVIYDEGEKGHDLLLSLDLDLQLEVEEIVSNTLLEASNNAYRKYLDEMYIVMMDPVTGEVLCMVGKEKTSDNEIIDKSYGTYMDLGAVVPGSVVKGATVYMGLTEGLIQKNEYILDAPLYFRATPVKKSWRNFGMITEIDALKWSSNVYMFHIAMRLADTSYIENGPLYMKDLYGSFDIMRKYFRSFGLGTITGIDLPGESIGYIGRPTENGHLLDYSIGQFDTYTVLQLAQYVSTIANDGKKVTPHILVEAYETGTQEVVYTYPVEVQNVLEDQEALKQVQKGLRECVASGYCASYLSSVSEPVAAKSGTAEAYFTNEEGEYISSPNSSFIAYAPYDEPEVAIACAAPHAWNDVSQSNVCQKVVADALQTYFDLNK
ncbi:MAG: penicillin-binding protein 2 [Erysipelotrichales bacterium]|nr:penicillin-binding protein 2 [Erysipelotrichales bacterium]